MTSGHSVTAAAPTPASGLIASIERAIGALVEYAAGILVVVETLILFAGVVSRYLIRRPFTWTDELASILFLWLAMFGAVVAYQRREHMRMSALVNGAGPRGKALLEAFALALGVAFLALVLLPAVEYAHDEIMIVTPALEIPNIWRASALPVGIILMLVLGVLRIGRQGTVADFVIALAVIGLVAGGLYAAKPALMAMGNYRLIVFFVLLVAAGVLAGAPIAFVFGIAKIGRAHV